MATLDVLEKVERAEDPTDYHADLAGVVKRLTESGLDAYFLEPLRQAKAGFMVEKSASLGMSSALRVMAPMVRGILARMDGPQLLAVCGHLRQLMR